MQLALGGGAGGRAYLINDRELITFRQFIAALADIQGLSIDSLRSVPYQVAFALGRFMEIAASLRSEEGDPPLTRAIVRMIGREFTTSNGADLGYVGGTFRTEGLEQMASAP
ncbi:hypothetical protein [Mycolicibacterium komossense]|uniref:Uncharacterized protein n=1 Tax=Mycolicibacterium komossense TaxID=1779 RepID=A0ABT3CEZ3_9MYCO|nr:hypothetical protein [Mycolicibacterium komossense]MCV7228055.1 hypothetical protein [Mycolicibacterium komossense]